MYLNFLGGFFGAQEPILYMNLSDKLINLLAWMCNNYVRMYLQVGMKTLN